MVKDVNMCEIFIAFLIIFEKSIKKSIYTKHACNLVEAIECMFFFKAHLSLSSSACRKLYTFSTSSSEPLHAKLPHFPQILLKKCCTFHSFLSD